MIRSLWSRLFKRNSDVSTVAGDNLLAQARTMKRANALREIIKTQAKSPDFTAFRLPKLLGQLRLASWSELELEKVQAYADFFSGANARGYDRVIRYDLARSDYDMFMTACTHCYLADRFSEGMALLDIFQPSEDTNTDWLEYYAFAGYICLVAGKPIKNALTFFDQALDLGRYSSLMATNAYPIYFEAGQIEQCRILRGLIHRNCANDPEVTCALAGIELARDYYGEGFRLLEARYELPNLSRTIKISLLQKPRWNNQSLAGKRILIHGEQGLGDMIMMCRYLPLLFTQGAEILLDGRAEASSLITHNFPYCRFIAVDLQSPVTEPFDYWTGIMSLPFHFQTTFSNVPSTRGYLSVPPEQHNYWQHRIHCIASASQVRVGLTWSGNPGHRADRRRSMSFGLICSLVKKHPNIHFFSLQTHIPESHPDNLVDIAEELLTLADTAAVIAEMDLVISVDTSAIHLAGALGCPAWLLLPYRYEWRWGLEGEANAWYSSVRVLRQKQHDAWESLLNDVSSELKCIEKTDIGD